MNIANAAVASEQKKLEIEKSINAVERSTRCRVLMNILCDECELKGDARTWQALSERVKAIYDEGVAGERYLSELAEITN